MPLNTVIDDKIIKDQLKGIPVIVVHKGCQEYLRTCINYATDHGHRVVLIGDQSNVQLAGDKAVWVDHSELESDKQKEFVSLYKHMSTNPYGYEKFCFERHFLAYEYVKKMGIDQFFIMDSDVLLGSTGKNGEQLLDKVLSSDVALCWSENQSNMSWSASPHFSFWRAESLQSFIGYLIDVYKNNDEKLQKKNEWHIKNKVDGGICDMTLLYLWINDSEKKAINFCSKDNTDLGVENILRRKEEERYIINDGLEKICFIDGIPCFQRSDNREFIPAFVIHAQGDCKRYMGMLSKGKYSAIRRLGVDIKEKIRARFK